ncbi:MAG TPA: hypothetical protein VGU46_00395 [Acidobacteriaceae bacterium]|nr:hypothetical protein [Acidobacteriaceae bacterium]
MRISQPLHQIRHFCFGALEGQSGLLLYFMFPDYNFIRGLDSSGRSRGSGNGGGSGSKDKVYSTLLQRKDEVMLTDEIILPAINKIVASSNILSDFPATAAIIKANAQARGREQYIKVPQMQEQILSHVIQARFLDALWVDICQRIEEMPRFACFRHLTLFLNQKNTKDRTMNQGFTSVIGQWRSSWAAATASEFLDPHRTYVDVGKQISSSRVEPTVDEDAGLAETFLYRNCCLDTFFEKWNRIASDPGDASTVDPATATASTATATATQSAGFARTRYMWATLRDAGSQTITAAPTSQAFKDGYVYGQFYNKVKAPFDSAKVYIFNNENLENIALDPAYVRSLNRAGGSAAFSQQAGLLSYLASKNRAHVSLEGSQHKSYGVREEHRISLALLDEICIVWPQWQSQSRPLPLPPPLPYYIITSPDMFRFLRAQINKYCLLFEHVLAGTNKTHSLPEFVMMVLALRALRFSYGSSILSREGLLYKDQWQRLRRGTQVTLEGIGMAKGIRDHGIGWFLPKINWQTFRVVPPHVDHFLAGNILLHQQYQQRWRAVRDLRDVYIRLGQADEWFARYDLSGSGSGQRAWLDFLHGLNLNQFDHDVASALQRSHKAHPELAGEVSIERLCQLSFSHEGMQETFEVEGVPLPPHSITGNRSRFWTSSQLIDFLFGFDDDEKRASWASMAYRLIYQKTCEMIKQHMGRRWQRRWRTEFKFLLQLTHWILPHANDKSFLNLTKTNQHKGLVARTSWFSAVYREQIPDWSKIVKQPQRSLATILAQADTVPLPLPSPLGWEISSLIRACQKQGLTMADLVRGAILGREQVGLVMAPIWEQGRPPQLQVCQSIQEKTLDELEVVFTSMIQRERERYEADAQPEEHHQDSEVVARSLHTPSTRDVLVRPRTDVSSRAY